MRRSTSLSFALILGLFAVVSATPVVLAQEESEPRQDQGSSFEGITVAPSDDARLRGERLQLFDVTLSPITTSPSACIRSRWW